MNKRVALYGTSLLLPGNRHWRRLADRYDVQFGDFGEWANTFLEGDDAFESSDVLVWVVFLDDLIKYSSLLTLAQSHDLKKEIDELISGILTPLVTQLRRSSTKVIVTFSKLSFEMTASPNLARQFSIESIIAKGFESTLQSLREDFTHLYLLSLDQVISEQGFQRCFDFRNFYAARSRFSSFGIQVLANEIMINLERIFLARKKLLILDCDNTLWGGVLGEAGQKNIQIGQDGIGQAFQDFQYVIKGLSNRGILLALASKNNHDDVVEVFDNHKGMILKKADFVSMKVNWEDKANSIREISNELSLGIDSFVFWDDSPIERDMTKTHLPELTVVEPPADVYDWPLFLRKFSGFSHFNISSEDKNKKKQYKIRAQFNKELDGNIDKVSYLKSIKMRPEVFEVDTHTLDRAQQLCNKTNQFNLRTIRHTHKDLEKIVNSNNNVALIAKLSDKFGEHGLVGLSIVKSTSNSNVAFLDTFLLSCRVIGRYLEAWVLKQCLLKLQKNNVKYLLAEYIPTKKNVLVENFLSSLGFKPIRDMPVKVLENIKLDEISCAFERTHYIDITECNIPNLGVFENE
ncbi:MAG: HAD-IIIC family phosphatase [Bacteriovoracaceae bacterium]|nr:HAD-IIIC family phosphatase [Bacteriovoracaceae bacterium]